MKENTGSIKIAKDIGFELDKSSILPDDPWIKYQYKNRHTKTQNKDTEMECK